MLRRAAATATHALTLAVRLGPSRSTCDELPHLPGVAVDVVSPDGLDDEVRRRWLERDADRTRHFFICGVGDVVPRLRDLLRGGGYDRRAVQYEKW